MKPLRVLASLWRSSPRGALVSSGLPSRLFAIGVLAVASGCASGAAAGGRSETAEKWFQRAQHGFNSAELDEAHDAAAKALAIAPDDRDVRLLAGRIALAELEYAEVQQLLKGVPGSEAAGLRGRAHWYKGDLEAAADELEAMLNDPEVVDEWAKSISKLARRGTGRQPFAVSGGLVAAVELPHVSPLAPFYIVPLEIDGESALALVATGTAEVVLDSAMRQEPGWVSLRFDKRLEVRDVPALAQDLSGLSKQIGAPIKALLGVNLLRHIHATLDYGGRQFVARNFAPPPPPNATRLRALYGRGGGLVLKSSLEGGKTTTASLLVDSSMTYPVALDEAAWAKIGVDAKTLHVAGEDGSQTIREGLIPLLRLGTFEIPKVPAVFGARVDELEKNLKMDLDGVIGAGLMAHFRLTFADGGRFLWLEDNGALLSQPVDDPGPAPTARPDNEAEAPPAKAAPAAPKPKR